MCETCGCGESDDFKIHDRQQNNEPDHHHDHEHGHTHTHEHDGVTYTHSHEPAPNKVISLNIDILSENNKLAQLNRRFFEGRKVLCLNLVSSPGSGKTSILEKTIQALIPV